MREFYTSAPDGLIGNEDCGQMSAWYVFSAMGFYPVCPGDNQYVLGSPIFDKATINLENGKKLCIIAKNQSKKNIYVQSVKLNGKPYPKSYITFDDINDGGMLEFIMGEQPNLKFGTEIGDRPRNEVEPTITIVPTFEPMQRSFKDSLLVSINLYQTNKNFSPESAGTSIYYTLDGTKPHPNAGVLSPRLTNETHLYTAPFTIKENSHITAIACNNILRCSNVVEAHYFKFQKDKSIKILSKYSSQYTADGDEGLIDYIRGNVNFRLGGWQGYQAQDFEAIVDLESVQEVHEIGAGFLRDIRSWIFFPTSMQVEISLDGVHYTTYGDFVCPHSHEDYTPMVEDFMIRKEAKARYIKVKADNYGVLPEWHLGAGYPAFIFIDEIIVR
jgi:hypothetical protein